MTIKLLKQLGFIINFSKSAINPSKRCKYLGFILDSEKCSVDLTDKKKKRIVKLLNQYEVNRRIKIQDFAHLLGVLVASCPGVEYSNIYCKRFERAKWLALLMSDNNYEGYMNINNSIMEDIEWWKRNIAIGINPIKTQNYKLTISSDASRTGWGAESNGVITHGLWNQKDLKYHINYLELQAAFFAIQCFASNVNNCEILLRIDNTTAVAYINKAGGVKYPHLSELSRKI